MPERPCGARMFVWWKAGNELLDYTETTDSTGLFAISRGKCYCRRRHDRCQPRAKAVAATGLLLLPLLSARTSVCSCIAKHSTWLNFCARSSLTIETLAVIYELAGSPPFTVVATLVALPFTTI
jgi:hypothetical protein